MEYILYFLINLLFAVLAIYFAKQSRKRQETIEKRDALISCASINRVNQEIKVEDLTNKLKAALLKSKSLEDELEAFKYPEEHLKKLEAQFKILEKKGN